MYKVEIFNNWDVIVDKDGDFSIKSDAIPSAEREFRYLSWAKRWAWEATRNSRIGLGSGFAKITES